MNLLKDTDKVFAAMVEVEGEKWKRQEGPNEYTTGDTYFWGVVSRLKELTIPVDDEETERELSVTFGWEIYGDAGLNRYPVYLNGDVGFSRYHCWDKEKLKKAQELGFRIV